MFIIELLFSKNKYGHQALFPFPRHIGHGTANQDAAALAPDQYHDRFDPVLVLGSKNSR
jgi:hypothetical protein